jgi:uncharacterized Tic20 family protein
MNPKDERLYACLTHIAPIILSALSMGIACFIAPLVVYLVYKDKSKFVAFHALQALYFQLAVLVIALLCIPLCFILIGFALLIVLVLADLVLPILGCIGANNGELWEYPVVGAMARRTVGI